MISIVVSTDNHVGFMERDPVRRDDSFAAFEEVLTTARTKKASPRLQLQHMAQSLEGV